MHTVPVPSWFWFDYRMHVGIIESQNNSTSWVFAKKLRRNSSLVYGRSPDLVCLLYWVFSSSYKLARKKQNSGKKSGMFCTAFKRSLLFTGIHWQGCINWKQFAKKMWKKSQIYCCVYRKRLGCIQGMPVWGLSLHPQLLVYGWLASRWSTDVCSWSLIPAAVRALRRVS